MVLNVAKIVSQRGGSHDVSSVKFWYRINCLGLSAKDSNGFDKETLDFRHFYRKASKSQHPLATPPVRFLEFFKDSESPSFTEGLYQVRIGEDMTELSRKNGITNHKFFIQ